MRTGYSAVADEWFGVRPGTDGLLIMALIHELMRTRNVDLDYMIRYTNAPWLVIDNPGSADDGLFARDNLGIPLIARADGTTAPHTAEGVTPSLTATVTLADGRKARPVFALMAEKYLDAGCAPDAVAERCGIPAERIRSLAAELARVAFEEEISIEQPWIDWKGEKHDRFIGRPVSMHAMRGISAHSNGFQTCRALHMLQILLGSIDCPGGFRYKPPYPKPAEVHPKPAGKPAHVSPGTPMPGAPLGYPQGPEDLLLDNDGAAMRIDGAYTWDAPMSAHGMMHMVISNAHAKKPYGIDVFVHVHGQHGPGTRP